MSTQYTKSSKRDDEDGGNESAVKRFSGVPEDHYRETWRAWAKKHLFGMPDSVAPKKHGARLSNLLDGEAARICKHMEIGASDPNNELGVEGAEDKLFAILDRRWPEKPTTKKETEAMTAMYKHRYVRGANVDKFVGETRTIFEDLAKANTLVPETMKGQMMARMFGLSEDDFPVLLALTGKSWAFEKIADTLPEAYPNGPPAPKHHRIGVVNQEPPSLGELMGIHFEHPMANPPAQSTPSGATGSTLPAPGAHTASDNSVPIAAVDTDPNEQILDDILVNG